MIGGAVGGAVAYQTAIDSGKTGSELVREVMKGIGIGGALGLAAGGAAVMLGGVVAGALASVGVGAGTFMGVSAFQSFAIGAIAFDFTAFFIAPLLGWEMQGVEYETPSSPYRPEKPQPLPKHPASLSMKDVLNNLI